MLTTNKVKTYSVKKRFSKVRAADFASVLSKKASFAAFYASLPNILKAKDIRAVVDAIVQAKRKKKAVIFLSLIHI